MVTCFFINFIDCFENATIDHRVNKSDLVTKSQIQVEVSTVYHVVRPEYENSIEIYILTLIESFHRGNTANVRMKMNAYLLLSFAICAASQYGAFLVSMCLHIFELTTQNHFELMTYDLNYYVLSIVYALPKNSK